MECTQEGPFDAFSVQHMLRGEAFNTLYALRQVANGKVQSFSKFQAELRAKQAQKYSKRHR